MLPGGVKRGAPATVRRVGAFQGMMAKLLAVGALGVLVEAKVSFQLEGGGEGRQAPRGGKVLCLGAFALGPVMVITTVDTCLLARRSSGVSHLGL